MSDDDRELAITAARAGAAIVRSHFGTALDRVQKAPGDFATTADLEAERAIRSILRAARPDDAVLGEEDGRSGGGSNGRTWFVDPLCGTLNFAAETTLVAVNVAVRAGTRVTAAVADPFTDEVFWSDGDTAGLRAGAVDRPLVPSGASRLVDVNLDPPWPTARALRLVGSPGFAERFRLRVVSSTLALAWVAAGRRAAYVIEGDLSGSVHFEAGLALCAAAGCVLTGIDGQPLHTGAGGLVAAADAETHAALLALVTAR